MNNDSLMSLHSYLRNLVVFVRPLVVRNSAYGEIDGMVRNRKLGSVKLTF